MIVPGPARRHIDLEADFPAQALAGGDPRCRSCFCHLRFPFSSSLRAPAKQSIAQQKVWIASSLALLAMTSGRRHFVINGIIGIARFLAAIEGLAVIRGERKSFPQAARQVRVGNEDAAERDRVGMSR